MKRIPLTLLAIATAILMGCDSKEGKGDSFHCGMCDYYFF